MSKSALREIETSLKALSGKSSKGQLFRHGITVPSIRKRLKAGYSFLDTDSDINNLATWDYIWKKQNSFESMSMALYFYQHRSLAKKEYQTLKNWVDQCTCWEHSDDLSKIYAQVVEDNPSWILKDLRKWNKSKSSWKRRQSLVSLLEYSSKRKKVQPFNTMISFVKNLLDDEEYYVQKGLGWTLREIYNVYPKETIRFIEAKLGKISPIAYSAATEKIERSKKIKLNERRKSIRSKHKR